MLQSFNCQKPNSTSTSTVVGFYTKFTLHNTSPNPLTHTAHRNTKVALRSLRWTFIEYNRMWSERVLRHLVKHLLTKVLSTNLGWFCSKCFKMTHQPQITISSGRRKTEADEKQKWGGWEGKVRGQNVPLCLWFKFFKKKSQRPNLWYKMQLLSLYHIYGACL